MRPLEVIIPILLAVFLVWRRPRPLAIRLLPLAALIGVLIHLGLEGYRWQMIPIYLLASTIALRTAFRFKSTEDWKPLGSILTLVLLAVSTVLPILLPVPSIPIPDGPYEVGTTIYELTDTTRKELYSGKDEPRRFQIQVWYPAEPSPADTRAPWMNHAAAFAPYVATYIGMPAFFLDHLALVKIPAFRDARVAASGGGYPIILFSHGWNGFNAQNSGQALQLASHGYVVVGVQHTYGAVVTIFEDGTVARNNPAALPKGAPDAEYDAAAHKLAKQWAGDLGFALDTMTDQNNDPGSPFFGALDLTRTGVYGHSTGGGAAIQFCSMDPRCNALLGMDPFMRPVSSDVLESGLTQPAFFMFSQRWADDVDSLNNRQFHPFYENSKAALGAISIDGTAHFDFSDLPLLSPLAPSLGLKGPINGARVTTIVDDYLLSFFERTLRDQPSNLFSKPGENYMEVHAAAP